MKSDDDLTKVVALVIAIILVLPLFVIHFAGMAFVMIGAFSLYGITVPMWAIIGLTTLFAAVRAINNQLREKRFKALEAKVFGEAQS